MSSQEVILHHFDASPFAEKVRVALGIKELSWRSVEIPMVMPKPDLTALTGGYRKTPVMQIGADVFCDTQRIATELNDLGAGPSLFPGDNQGLCAVIAAWSDASLFIPGAGLAMGTNQDLPEAILADRFAFFDFLDRKSLPQQLPSLFARFRAGLQRIEDMLADERSFLLGDTVSWADASCYAPVWMCRSNIAHADELMKNLPLLEAWEQRMKAFGHGRPTVMKASEALKISSSTHSLARPLLDVDAWPKLELDRVVTVTPEDYGAVPVRGRLVRLSQYDVAVARSDERAGEVVVHFPRAGYRVEGL
ncbi:glutathione S-transferase family protein [Seongchinamella unica]|uniref:Glutathione S-transferase family protein n=1 Tax=Seongchinamella unica TaxID=2547392 RepID=A0A4R5LVA6_9GAMM|nr:glutathione S-transferase family protein [Seongchinamella unica]TDG15330.1 glutathione S-transferase family protein [Seongchinamella unica]